MNDMNFTEILNKFNSDNSELDSLAYDICKGCTSSLDSMIEYAQSCLINNSIPDEQLDGLIINLPMYIYYASEALEHLGLKEDISAFAKKTKMNKLLSSPEVKGTAQQKTAQAELQCADDVVLNALYSRAYKMAKAKIDCAYELLASCKKVASRRIEELKAFNSDPKLNDNRYGG